jgi:hypothetical protein
MSVARDTVPGHLNATQVGRHGKADTMAKRLGYGEGTIWQRKDGYWAAQITAGWTERGTRYRPTVVGKTRAEVDRKRKAMLLEYRTKGQAASSTGG